MSPEMVNGGPNNPPTITKRKKKNKKTKINNNNDINNVKLPYNNLNLNTTENPYFPFNYTIPTEPMSLPVCTGNYGNPFKLALNYGGNVNPMNFPFLHLNGGSNDVNEYISLPVAANLIDQNDNEENRRRFSDPCLPNDSDSSTNSNDETKDDVLIKKLMQQITMLSENQQKMNREMMEMRIEMNMLKQQVCIGHGGREYEPGMLSDVIREVRDAARVREDALLARVKHMIEEKELVLNQLHLTSEKNRHNDRLLRLEEQLKNLNVNQNRSDDNIYAGNASCDSSGIGGSTSSVRQVMELETENVQLRKELQAQREGFDKKLKELDMNLEKVLRQKNAISSGLESYEDGSSKTSSDTISIGTIGSNMSSSPGGGGGGIVQTPRKITLSGPVTDL